MARHRRPEPPEPPESASSPDGAAWNGDTLVVDVPDGAPPPPPGEAPPAARRAVGGRPAIRSEGGRAEPGYGYPAAEPGYGYPAAESDPDADTGWFGTGNGHAAHPGPPAHPGHPAHPGLDGYPRELGTPAGDLWVRDPAEAPAAAEAVEDEVEAADQPAAEAAEEPAGERPKLSTGVILFWIGMLAVSGSTFIVLALLSRRGKPGELAAISVVFALTFITQMLPAAIQLRAAALVSTQQRVPRAERRVVLVPTLILLVFAPLAPHLIHAPAPAVAAVGLTFPPSLWLARNRGALIGQRRFGETGASCGVEACWRLGAGSALGWMLGATGVALGLLVAVLVSLATTPAHRPQRGGRRDVAVGSLTESLLSTGMLIALVQLDVLVAPGVLSPAAADNYAAAALPAKGIFLGLMAAGWFAVPDASTLRRRWDILKPAVMCVAAGLACAVVVIAAFPLVSAILGQAGADRGLGTPLVLAMSIAVGTRVEVNLGVARGQSRPWLALLPSIVLIGAVAVMHPSAGALSWGVLVAHALAFGICAFRLILSGPVVTPEEPAGVPA